MNTDRYPRRMFALCVLIPCLAMLAIAAIATATEVSAASGTVSYEPAPEHKCYAVTHALGSSPVEVPCDTASNDSPTTPTAQAPTPTAGQTRSVPAPRDHACFPARRWGPAPDRIRPCILLIGNRPESGAVRFVVSDASGVVRYSGYVNTDYRLTRVRIVWLAEDGSFGWKARSVHGCAVTATVGNLQD